MKTCINPNCGRPYHPLRKGRCARCDAFLRRTGFEYGETVRPTSPETTCECGEFKDRRSAQCFNCRIKQVSSHANGEKHCRGCDRTLKLECFSLRAGWKPRARCKECEVSANVEYAKANREKVRESKRRYSTENPGKARRWALRTQWKARGFDPDHIESLYQSKPQSCDICDSECDPVLDHCHATNKLRGWLCERCNMAIGLLLDNPESCKRAAEYLERHRTS